MKPKAKINIESIFFPYQSKLGNLAKILMAIACIFCLYMQPASSLTAKDIPEPDNASYIVDLANILDTDVEAKINAEIEQLYQRKQKSIYIVTVDEIEQKSVRQLYKIVPPVSPSRKFLESILLNWNIDDLKHGNSILFLVSVEDRSVEIRSGYNLKYIIRDRHIQGVIDKLIVPQFKQNNFVAGISNGIEALTKKIDNPYYSKLPDPENPTWESQVKLACKSRNRYNPLSNYGYDSGYVYKYRCSNEISYHGGGGTW